MEGIRSISARSDITRDVETEADIEQCLDTLLAANREYANRPITFNDIREELKARTMARPISSPDAYALFGLFLGTFPPAAITLKFFVALDIFSKSDAIFLVLFTVANLVTAGIGFLTGKLVGKMMLDIDRLRWSSYLPLLPFIGLIWGVVSGGVGGVFILVLGALAGAAIGGITAAAAFPVFAVLHRVLARGNLIERRHLLPISLGIAMTIAAFIIGL
jgi:hypothetical protein